MTPRIRSVAGAAASVALLTVLARLAGFGRILAFSRTVGDTCLGTAYQTANQVPNVLFEVVAGGALAGVLVPLLSSRLASDDPRRRADASRTASAALTWSVVLLVVVAGLTALLARPVMGLLLGDGSVEDCGDSLLRAGTVLLWVFLPQVPLYAVAVVFAGVLQAQQRFTAPAAAPLVSSLVVGASYLVVGGGTCPPPWCAGTWTTSRPAPSPCSPAVRPSGSSSSPSPTPPRCAAPCVGAPPGARPPGTGGGWRRWRCRAWPSCWPGGFVTVGVTVAANAVSVGAVNRWSYAWAMFLLPYAVLAVPVATAVFPRLARAADASRDEFAGLLAPAVRTVLLVSSLGAGVLAATAPPVAVVFVVSRVGSGRSGDLTASLVLSPGCWATASPPS